MRALRSLFERLQRGPTPTSRSTRQDLDEIRASIIKNLERILNSRAGMSAACESYGIPDMTQIVRGIPERRLEIEQALARCIEEYEPRLTHIEVRHDIENKTPMVACFQVHAAISTGKTAEEVWFDTVVVSSGRVRLR